MKRTISLEDNFAMYFVADNWDKNINVCLTDNVNNTTTILATWENGKWISSTQSNIDKFFKLMKFNHKAKRKLKETFKDMNTNSTDEQIKSVSKTWKCFRRRFSIEIYKILK
jgi:hypothetical protein